MLVNVSVTLNPVWVYVTWDYLGSGLCECLRVQLHFGTFFMVPVSLLQVSIAKHFAAQIFEKKYLLRMSPPTVFVAVGSLIEAQQCALFSFPLRAESYDTQCFH